MSGTPKYSQASLAAEQERRIAEEQLQRALAAERIRRQREAAEQRRQKEEHQRQLQQSLGLLAQQATQLKQSIPAHKAASYGRFAASEWSRLAEEVDLCLAGLEQVASAPRLGQAKQKLAKLDRELAATIARARASEQAERLRQDNERRKIVLTAELMLLRGEHSRLDMRQAAALDPSGDANTNTALREADELLGKGHLDAAAKALDEARAKLVAHQEAVRLRLAEREVEQDEAQRALGGLRSEWVGLESDEVIMTWCRAEVAAVDKMISQASSALAAENYSKCTNECRRGADAISVLIQKAEKRQQEEEKRSYLVSSLVEVLRQQTFLVSEPQLSVADDLDSTVVIHATRTDRRSILLQIPRTGPVEYDVDGYEKRIEPGLNGTSATCDEAEARLSAIHNQLESDFGIQMGELYWAGRDPLRTSRTGRPLPNSSTKTRQRGQS